MIMGRRCFSPPIPRLGTHFGHSNIIQFCDRPFASVEEMDYNLIKNWNEKVPPDGLVFHLGDFGWGGYQEYKKIRDQLNGKIILIKGNHKYFINN